MSAHHLAAASVVARPRPAARGFTLLEVLVSIGIIIGALAGIAALLPAAGARLGEATEIDRAGALAANARADLLNRGLVRFSLWSGATPAVVFGEGLTNGGASTIAHATVAAANAAQVSSRIDPTTGFQLRDSLQTTGTGVVTGYEPGICCGCMLSSAPAPAGPGATVRMSTVVFRRPGPAVQSIALTQTGSGSTVFTTGSGAAAALTRNQFLTGCSWVLAVGSGEPRWVQIASSWTAYPPGAAGAVLTSATGSSYVSLSGTDFLPLVSGSTLQVFGFDGLLRVDERFVNLE